MNNNIFEGISIEKNTFCMSLYYYISLIKMECLLTIKKVIKYRISGGLNER